MKKIVFIIAVMVWFDGNAQNVFKISHGTVLKITGDAFVVSENTSLVNDGSFQQLPGKGAFKFTGDSNMSIGGKNTAAFRRLMISNSGKTKLFLHQSISVSEELNFAGGLLDLNSFNIDLGTTGLLTGENETTRVVGDKGGYIQIVRNLNAPSSVNPGNLGAIFSSSQNLGQTIIRRSHQLQSNNPATNSAVLRSFDISSVNDIDFNTRLRFTYLDAELNKADEEKLVIWRTTDNRTWTNLGFNSRSIATNFVERTLDPAITTINSRRFIYQIAINDQSTTANKPGNYNSDGYQTNGMRIWPNPVVDDLWVDIGSAEESKAIIKIVDEKGSLVSSQQDNLNPGKNLLKVDMKKIPAGTYLILVDWAGGVMQQAMKFVKMK